MTEIWDKKVEVTSIDSTSFLTQVKEPKEESKCRYFNR